MGLPLPVDMPAQDAFAAARLEQVFARCFFHSMQTRLTGGSSEPLYQPAVASGASHTLYYRADYFASALHEIAHWCIAGPERRLQVDFGYWYAPQGRNAGQQQAFEAVECQPQALEWFFAKACAYRFRISVDNLDPVTGALPDTMAFRRKVLQQALYWQRTALPERAHTFFLELCREFNTAKTPGSLQFSLAELD